MTTCNFTLSDGTDCGQPVADAAGRCVHHRWPAEGTSHQQWVETTTYLLTTYRDESWRAWERDFVPGGNPAPLDAELARIEQNYLAAVLGAWKRHRPDGPLPGEVLPNEVERALKKAGG